MKTNSYEYLITMPSQFELYIQDDGRYDIDQINNPNGVNEQDIQKAFLGFYGDKGWGQEETRYRSIPQINELIGLFGYTLNHKRECYIDKEYVVLKLFVETNALGHHLETILRCIVNDFEKIERGFETYIHYAKMVRHGWQNMKPEVLVECEHTRSRFKQIMNDKDGTIVEVRQCSKCKKLFKRAIDC